MTPPVPLSPTFDPAAWTAAAIDDLRTVLVRAGYTVDGVRVLLGDAASAALARNETTPAVAVLDRRDSGLVVTTALAVMARLWTVQGRVDRAAAERAFGHVLEPLLCSGILVGDGGDGGDLRAAIDLRPYGDETVDGWVVSDLIPGLDGMRRELPDDYVLGVNDAATTLAGLTLRHPVARVLDLGTGSGLQTVHLAQHAETIVGTDVNPRALRMARFAAALNGVDVDWRDGSLLTPVAGETFDLVVTNPPFVVSPGPDVSALTYRDSGVAGDAMVLGLVRDLPSVLAPGGVAQMLANWAHVAGEDWRDRLAVAVDAAAVPVHLWAVERELLDPAAYVEVWLADAGMTGSPGYVEHYRRWLDWFDEAGIEAVGMGWLTLHRPSTAAASVDRRFDELSGPVEQPLAEAVARWVDAVDFLAGVADDTALRGARLRATPELLAEQWSAPGAPAPEHLVLRQQGLLRRAQAVDPALAGFVGACDGDLDAGTLVDAIASVLDVPEDDRPELAEQTLRSARDLLTAGLLLPPATSPTPAGAARAGRP